MAKQVYTAREMPTVLDDVGGNFFIIGVNRLGAGYEDSGKWGY